MKMRKHNRAVHKKREFWSLRRKWKNVTATFTESVAMPVRNFYEAWIDYMTKQT